MILKGLALFLIFSISIVVFAQEEQAFWKSKSKIYNQIIHSRKIVVSAKMFGVNGSNRIRVIGAGLVQASLDQTLSRVREFEKLPQISGYFKQVRHDKKNKKVYFYLKALGYESRILLKYSWSKKSTLTRQMDWIVIWGKLKGMQGNFQFEPISSATTLMSTWASFDRERVPLPYFLMGFTLEVIAERIAQKMRNSIEESELHNEELNGRSNKKWREKKVSKGVSGVSDQGFTGCG